MRRLLAALMAATLLVAVAAAPAPATQGERQTFGLTFTTDRAAASTGFFEAIDYVNPDDAQAKALAVETVVVRLPTGTEVDTSVPEPCDAPDAVLIASGAVACPPDSVVGGGEVDLDTGVPGPGRLIRSEVTLLNDDHQVIFLFEREGGGRFVSRAQVTDASFTTVVPPIPGGPPDGFTAIDRVSLEVRPISAEPGTNYITTPPSCPAGGAWSSTATFSYRDGISQAVGSPSPCRAGSDPEDPGAGGHHCANPIPGGKRSERLDGSAGADLITGRGGDDRILGRGGDDCLRGGSGADRVRGGAGDDAIRGGRGPDRLRGRRGDDVIRAARGAHDRVSCGPGDDIAFIDSLKDAVKRDCETVRDRA
ncbi:MAG: calcium-binding protein [Solirubrobacterales bacterium]